jgi:alkanesulfonate monooxygenase SsuD/methylene tetrahydromethanopterin reductase-like flavin-dependent oxidoreductase (luciferase family)
VSAQVEKLKPLVEARGRDIGSVDVIAELELRLASSSEKAVQEYRNSRQGKLRTEIRKMPLGPLVAGNWIGTPDDVCEKVAALIAQGTRHFSVLNIASDSIEDRLEQMQMFAEQVMSRFRV